METTQHPMYQGWYDTAARAATRIPTPELTERRDGAARMMRAERPESGEYVCAAAVLTAYDRELIRRSTNDTVAAIAAR